MSASPIASTGHCPPAAAAASRSTAVAWRRALRPFSFSIAIVSCALGAALAWRDGYGDAWRTGAVLLGGLLLQAGVNLVNDYHEVRRGCVDDKLPELGLSPAERLALERRIHAVGLACLAAVVPVGLWLTRAAGAPLLALGAVGLVGAYGYTGEPLNYKRRGLAVAFVFFLMGVLMIGGAYLAVAGRSSAAAAWCAIPVSCLVSLLLLGNELRDAEDDARHGVRTLTVRIGVPRAVALYHLLAAAAYASAVALWWAGLAPIPLLLLLALPALRDALRHVRGSREHRRPLPPRTARFHLVFGTLWLLTLLLPALPRFLSR